MYSSEYIGKTHKDPFLCFGWLLLLVSAGLSYKVNSSTAQRVGIHSGLRLEDVDQARCREARCLALVLETYLVNSRLWEGHNPQ